jgi:hypothetical protein
VECAVPSGLQKPSAFMLRGTRNFDHAKFRCEKFSRICSKIYAPLKHERLGFRL